MTWLILFTSVGFIAVNWLAWKQAGSMVRVAHAGDRTSKPEQLSRVQKILVLLKGVNLPRRRNEKTPGDAGMKFTTFRIPGSQGWLEAWHIPSHNSNKIALLFHGYARNKTSLLAEAKLFHGLGISCLVLDFPGAGGSEGNLVTLGRNEARDVSQAATFAQVHWPHKQQILFGHSMGAVAILRAVRDYQLQASAIILESPFTTLLETVGARFLAMGVPPYPLAHLLLFWGSLRVGFNGFAHKPIQDAKLVDSPVLQIHGRHDPRVPFHRARQMFEQFPGEKQFVEFPDCSHESLAAKDPRRWLASVTEFLDKAPPQSRSRAA